MITRIEKATLISSEDIHESYLDSEYIFYEVKGSDGLGHYLVACNHDKLWRCTCDDFSGRGINKEEGSFLCKHIISVILHIAEKLEAS
ncbi:SWIM zinc finger family protein [Methanobrevibacter sp.]|uniref:SWIM zinc finger family protein n=1 Tax=Methanobrevibacter sp. TaxID=66852 RepID=UPI00262FB325|nr:SWIM zinc finger family protein [uncultured Methanobrevibacter sp.]